MVEAASSVHERSTNAARCNLCGWAGDEFAPRYGDHGLPVKCPRCASLGRVRHLYEVLPDFAPLGPDVAVLDVAPNTALAKRIAPQCQYVGIDTEPLRRRYGRDPAKRGIMPMDVTRLEYPDDYFHVALCSHVLEHVEDDMGALREIHRVLRPGGTLFLQVPGRNTMERTEHFLERDDQDHLRLYGFPELSRQLADIGFDVTRVNRRREHPDLMFDELDIFVSRKPGDPSAAPQYRYTLLPWVHEMHVNLLRAQGYEGEPWLDDRPRAVAPTGVIARVCDVVARRGVRGAAAAAVHRLQRRLRRPHGAPGSPSKL